MSDLRHQCAHCTARYNDRKAADICCSTPGSFDLRGGKYVLGWTLVMAVVWFLAVGLGVLLL